MDIVDWIFLCNKNIVVLFVRVFCLWLDYIGICLVRCVKWWYVFLLIIYLFLFYIVFLLIFFFCDVVIWRVKDKNVLSNIWIFFWGRYFFCSVNYNCCVGDMGIIWCNYDCIKMKFILFILFLMFFGCLN